MTRSIVERPRGRRPFRAITAIFASTVVAIGLSAIVLAAPAGAANKVVNQCNGTGGGGGKTVSCSVTVVNTLTNSPSTTGSIVNGVFSHDLVTSVTQCNGSANGGGSILNCSVHITNNISVTGAHGPSGATVNQCNANQPDGLHTAPNTCSPGPAGTSGARITQCNGTGNGGGLVNPSHCTASGAVSSTLPVTVNQCNGSANGGGSKVNCSTSITTNIVSSAASGAIPRSPLPTPNSSTTGVPGVTPIVGTPPLAG